MILRKSRGFSIVELMVSIALGTLIIATVGEIYLSNRTTNTIQAALARLQENGRYANFLLSKELRMAGFHGCGNQSKINTTNLVSNQPNLSDYDIAIKGYDGLSSSFSPSLPTYLTANPVPGNDVLEIRMASFHSVNLTSDMNQTNNPVLVDDRLGIQAGEIVMITDCSVADIFKAGANTNATAITHTVSNNTSNHLSIPYLTNAQVMRFFYYVFYIKDTGRTNAQGQPILALYRQNINGVEEEIAEGVEQMQITYGVDTNGDRAADSYQSAAQVNSANNWNSVISVNINLLFATIENVNTKAESYTFNGTTVTPSDRKLRRQWNTFVTLRNRGLPG
ncbi:hypothetical protein E3983_07985 [Legionella israelensis]|uniref:Tfp pilus assembly protein PilW n=1 Tax=Legionella israelensis TaxID=454 RepID=A0AAX1EJX8_9GAMM|nr:PilW family protein [Legionella israelensis]QBR85357.1 hypothetical protein E3983_07985 [Legionella israelensis]